MITRGLGTGLITRGLGVGRAALLAVRRIVARLVAVVRLEA